MESFCTFYIVRHGQTEWNAADRIQGHLDSPLTDKGINQAKETSEEFKSVKFDTVFSSDLLRAKRTAEFIVLNRGLEVSTAKALRERTLGQYDGRLVNEYIEETKELLKEYQRLSEEKKWEFKFAKDYESDEELASRFITFLREVAVGYQGKTVLIVTHGETMRSFLTKLGFAKHGALTPSSIKNTGYIIVKSDGVDFFLKKVQGVDYDKGIRESTL